MADNLELIDGMKTISAETRIDLDSPIVNLEDGASINSKGTSTINTTTVNATTANVTTVNATNVNVAGGIQSGAVAVTAGETAVAIPAGTTFASVTSANVAHIVKLPTPVLGNVLYIKEVGTNGFEIMPQANTQYINGTLCDVAKSLAMAANTGVAVFVCVLGGAAGKRVQYWIDDDGTLDAGGTPD